MPREAAFRCRRSVSETSLKHSSTWYMQVGHRQMITPDGGQHLGWLHPAPDDLFWLNPAAPLKAWSWRPIGVHQHERSSVQRVLSMSNLR